MLTYLKAEFGLCKKNLANFIIGFCCLFVFCLLLLFSGVGGVRYGAGVCLIGFITVLLFVIPWYLSPASWLRNRRKVVVSTEHMVLLLGESKRMFVTLKLFVCVVHWLLLLGVIAVMQLPAYLIAREQYSLLVFGTELTASTAMTLFSMVILFLCPGDKLAFGIPIWSGFCGGFIGGFLGGVSQMSDGDLFRETVLGAVIGATAFVGSVLYRYLKTVWEERRK